MKQSNQKNSTRYLLEDPKKNLVKKKSDPQSALPTVKTHLRPRNNERRTQHCSMASSSTSYEGFRQQIQLFLPQLPTKLQQKGIDRSGIRSQRQEIQAEHKTNWWRMCRDGNSTHQRSWVRSVRGGGGVEQRAQVRAETLFLATIINCSPKVVRN